MTENEIDKFILLRSILQSDDRLQIRPSGDFDRICLKLDYDIEITFFIDSHHASTSSLTINNLHDLHIYKLANKNSIKRKQWLNIRDYFNKLIQQSDSNTSLYSITQLIQEYISQNLNSNEIESSKTISFSTENASTPIQKFRGADLIFNRIAHDNSIDRSKVIIGYEDRFTGIHEVPYNEFKKVHDDELGIPMHRIRYYKINERIVWDRIKKFDILTGSETNDYIEQESNLTEGMYHFNQSTHQWILHPQSDDIKIPLMDDMYLPERCQFLTWNILSESIYPDQRYEGIFKTLKSLLPDIICLQEVTKDFLDVLLNEIWLKENNYYIILDSNQNQSYGQLMLMKNVRPRVFSIYPEYIIAQFGLDLDVTIDLVNVHLHKNSVEKRCQSLEDFFRTMKTQNYILIGDFNFGDYDIKEQNLLEKYQYEIYDLWKDIYDLEENPGYTFDLTRNTCAQISSNSQTNLRSDRYLFHRLHNLSYSIEHLNMTGLETIPIDSINNKRINQSDHFALQLIIKFRIRSISHRSALVILPTVNIPGSTESFRCLSFNQYPPHINLLSPFFDLTDTQDDEENILLPLRLFLSQYKSFNIEIPETGNHTSVIKLNQQSENHVKELYKQIKQLFPQCLFDDEDRYNPHMTIAQLDSNKKQKQVQSAFTKPIQFSVRYIYILQQSLDDPPSFRINYQIPLDSVLEPIGLNPYGYINSDLKEFFNKMNLYVNEKSFEQKHEKFNRLSICFDKIFNEETLHCFTHAFLPYGSFRLGLHGDDLDTVFVLSEQKSIENKTNLDQILLQLRYDPSELNNHIINLLENQIKNDLKDEIIDCRIIQALYPIISIVFNDQIRVEIFVQIKEKSILNQQYQDERFLLSNFHEPVHGVHDIELLIPYVRFPPIFQHLLTFIRTWAQNVGIYGQVYGYLGGYSWAILCAYICHKHLPSNTSIFSLEQFFILLKNFFSFYSHFNWTYESISLYSKHSCSDDNRGSMHILCPTSPFNNSSRSTINSTRYLIIQNLQYVNQLIEKTNNLEESLRISNQFPDKTIQSILQLRLSCKSNNELNQWIGYMKSRLAHFLTDCENDCDLFIQTDTNLHIRKDILERFYSIGFQLNEQLLSHHRQFYYTLNKFLNEFKMCSFRNENMKISYKLMPINNWNIERNSN